MAATVDRTAWSTFAQTFEFGFWALRMDREPNFTSEIEDNRSWELFRALGIDPESFAGKTVIDVGAGPTNRCRVLKGAYEIVIDPLADLYKTIPWATTWKADEVHSKPAEELIPELVEKADYVITVNCLDHCFDVPKILANIRAYLKPDGKALISTDCQNAKIKHHDYTHPTKIPRPELHGLLQQAGFEIEESWVGFKREARPGEPRRDSDWEGWKNVGDTYGGGDACHWWCLKGA